MLTITSGGHTVASLHLVGPYVTSNFTLSSGAGGSTEIIDPPVAGGVGSANAALFGSYMAASFVSAAGQFDGAAVATEGQTPHPVLTNPS